MPFQNTLFFEKYNLARKKQLDKSINKGTAARMLKIMNPDSDEENVQVTFITFFTSLFSGEW